MREFSQINATNINLLGQDIRDMLAIANHFPIQDIVGVKQDKHHGHKEYTVRLCNTSGEQDTSMRDLLVEISMDKVIVKDTLRIV